MGMLVLLLGVCCAGLLLLAGLLWLQVRQGEAESRGYGVTLDAPQRGAGVRTQLWVVHPRMDLASGRAPANQSVDLARRLDRSMEHRSRVRNVPVRFAPFAERRKLPQPRRQRLDLVYALETMGDLSDPDIRSVRLRPDEVVQPIAGRK